MRVRFDKLIDKALKATSIDPNDQELTVPKLVELMQELGYINEPTDEDKRKAYRAIQLLGPWRNVKQNLHLLLMGIENVYLASVLREQLVMLEGKPVLLDQRSAFTNFV